MKDRIVQYPHRYQLVPVEGEANTYDFVPVPGVVTEPGTDLSKATLLTDATVSLLESAIDGTLIDDTVNYALTAIAGIVGKNGVQLASGSYVGTGTYGVANPVVLTFDFEPKAVIIGQGTFLGTVLILIKGMSRQGTTDSSNTSSYDCDIIWGTNSVQWWNTTRASNQLNSNGTTFYYWAIG